jgi:pyridinium-3,5-bisthiocarboxylic acid mononucleotide nickel chelatase
VTGYLDLPSGLSGDMFLSCLVDAGWPIEALQAIPIRLGLPRPACAIRAQKVMRGPLRATLVSVEATPTYTPRHLHDIQGMIEKSDLSAAVKRRAVAIFTRLAQAEANVHGMTVEKVHFHEVGAIDAIVDIVGASAGIESLGIEKIYASPIPLGAGWIKTDHGHLPLPAPATLQLLAAAQTPTIPAPGTGELLTPTGAAILTEIAEFSQPEMTLTRIATGAGQKELAWPNVARLWLGQMRASGGMVQIETNIDDMNPQLFDAVSARLFEKGAADVWLTPIQMKKGRPAVTLNVLSPAALERVLADVILRETTTLGVRVHPVHRHEARREMRTVQTDHGAVGVKLKWIEDQIIAAVPEYEDCRRLAETAGLPTRLIWEAAQAASHREFLAKKS